MKASLSWIRSLVRSLDASDDELLDAFVRGGFEVRSTRRLQAEPDTLGPWAGEIPDDMPREEAVPTAFDTIVDLGETDRADVLGHVGLARELSAILRLPFQPPGVDAPVRVAQSTIESHLDVDVHDAERCPHYGVAMVDDVVVGPSPLWLRVRLRALGIEPRNAIVDLAHLVTLESGHPVEAFDLERIQGKLAVRLAHEGEIVSTASSGPHALTVDDLVVADDSGPVALAGVATASHVDVGLSTRRVVFSCGCFDPVWIRRTASRFGLHTESARRHGRGVDRNDAVEALAQAGALATRLAKAAAVAGTIHVFEQPWEAPSVVLSENALRQRLHVSLDRATDALARLDFDVVPLHGDTQGGALQVTIPSFRQDVHGEDDVMREIGRIHASWGDLGLD